MSASTQHGRRCSCSGCQHCANKLDPHCLSDHPALQPAFSNPRSSHPTHTQTCEPARPAQIIALGVSYFVAVSALDVTSNVGTIDDLTSLARMLLVLPVAALDAVFILWVFTSLSRTLNQLQARKATAKLELYR